jgi:hypothetical protein
VQFKFFPASQLPSLPIQPSISCVSQGLLRVDLAFPESLVLSLRHTSKQVPYDLYRPTQDHKIGSPGLPYSSPGAAWPNTQGSTIPSNLSPCRWRRYPLEFLLLLHNLLETRHPIVYINKHTCTYLLRARGLSLNILYNMIAGSAGDATS